MAASAEAAKASFSRLDRLGFSMRSCMVDPGSNARYDGFTVEFRGPRVDLRVDYHEMQMEIVLVRRRPFGENVTVSFWTIDRDLLGGASGYTGVGMFSPQQLPDALERLATTIESHCEELLAGKRAAWEQAATIMRSAAETEAARQKQLSFGYRHGHVREDAAKAFREGDFSKVVELLELLETELGLSPAEARKLQIARKRLERDG